MLFCSLILSTAFFDREMTLDRETFLEYSIVVIFLVTKLTNLHLELKSRPKKVNERSNAKVHQRFRMFTKLLQQFSKVAEEAEASMIAPISRLFIRPRFDNIFALRDSRREERRSLEGWQHGKIFWIVSLMWVLWLPTPSKPNLCFQDQKEVPKIGISGKSNMTKLMR